MASLLASSIYLFAYAGLFFASLRRTLILSRQIFFNVVFESDFFCMGLFC